MLSLYQLINFIYTTFVFFPVSISEKNVSHSAGLEQKADAMQQVRTNLKKEAFKKMNGRNKRKDKQDVCD